MSKVLIAGGAGFIGAYMARHLQSLGVEAIVLDAFRPYASLTETRDRELRRALLADSEIERMDLLDNCQLQACIARHCPDVVVHLAANPIVSAAELDPAGCERDIVGSTRSLVSAIEETRQVKRIVHVSSSMVYGNFFDGRVAETCEAKPVNVYGRMKLAAEQLILELGDRRQVQTVIVRPMAVYGPGDGYHRVISVFCAQAFAGLPLTVRTGAEASIDFSYVEDIAEGLALAAFKPAAAGMIFNLSHGHARSLLDVVAALQLHFPGLRYNVVPTMDPARPARGALDNAKARRLLGFTASTTLEMGIDRCIRFLRSPQRTVASATAGVSR